MSAADIRREEPPPAASGDPFLKDLIEVYRSYWTRALLQEVDEPQGDEFLGAQLAGFLSRHGRDPGAFPTVDDRVLAVRELVRERGLHIANGITVLHYDLMIWTRQVERRYDVTLPETSLQVPVLMILHGGVPAVPRPRGSALRGLSEVSRTGAAGAGVPREAGRADCRADTGAEGACGRFASRPGEDRNTPHNFANARVIRDLRAAFEGAGPPSQPADWNTVDPARVKMAARSLLALNTQALQRLGAATVSRIL